MEPKKSKYDTNPLDPDFVKRVGKPSGEVKPETQEVSSATREIGSSANENARQNIYSEAPTRRYDNVAPGAPYPSIFVPPTYSQPAPYQSPATPYRPGVQKPGQRTVAGIGIPEKWTMMLPYAPYLGVVVSLLELLLVPRTEPRARFHAAQGLALHIGILAIGAMFTLIGALSSSSTGGSLFTLAALIFLIVSMVRVWKGEPHYIAPIAEPSRWLNEHIEPRNKS